MGFGADTNNYYVLERTEDLAQPHPFKAVAMLLPASSAAHFEHQTAQAKNFYRIKLVSLSAPLDTDGDGLDDVYELRRLGLDPLDASDASSDPDENGLSYLQEYRAARFALGKRRVAVGDRHLLAIQEDGTLWTAGDNRFGQLGDGSTNSRATLIPINSSSRWRAVAAAGNRSYGIQTNGSLWCWGFNASYAPLGAGTTTNHLAPIRIGDQNDWETVALSYNHTIALKQNGSLWGWGGGIALGIGTNAIRATPVQIGGGTNWQEIDAGQNFSLALNRDGLLFATGINDRGQLGIGATNSPVTVFTPVASNFIWRAIAAGDFHSLAITTGGTMWAWGGLYDDAGGGALTATNRFAPSKIGTNSNWLGVGGGYQHSVAFDSDGYLWAWGYNYLAGTVGDGTQSPRPNPVRIAGSNTWLTAATRGGNHVGVRADATLWNWSGVNGQFTGQTGLFKAVMPEQRFQFVAAGNNHSAAIDEAGQVWCWGDNGSGQLGDASTVSGLPRRIASNFVATAISASAKYTMALDDAGYLWTWGTLGSARPYRSSLLTNLLQSTSSGGNHFIALDTENRVWAYGLNDAHQLPGSEFLTNSYVGVGAGGWSSFAVGLDGSVYMWGKFDPSNFGFTSGKVSTPGVTFRQVVGGAMHALAIRDDQTLWSMGNNTWGQLGIGTNSYGGLMKPVATNYTWRAVAAYYHNLAIRDDGTLWFWGYDANSAVTRSPVALSTNASWKAVAAGYKHSLAIQEDGSLWAWGNNEYGQLGVSPFIQMSSEPVWSFPLPK